MSATGSNRVVALASIIGAIGRDRTDVLIGRDLIQQLGQHGSIANITGGDLDGANFQRFVKRQKNDGEEGPWPQWGRVSLLNDAEAICEAAQRPSLSWFALANCTIWGIVQKRKTRFVPVKSEETQGATMVFRVRELLIRQRTQVINALRGHLTEFGQVVPQGASNASKLIAIIDDPERGLPAEATATLQVLIGTLAQLEAQIAELDARIARCARENEVARRLMTVHSPMSLGPLAFHRLIIGPLIATAIATLAPPPETFRKARDFAAWLGLVPRQHSTGGKQRLPKAAPASLQSRQYATLEWVDWFNNRRLLEPIGNIPPAEAEANFYAALERSDMAA